MIIPSGVTFYDGRTQYGEGMELPANAPEGIKKLCADRIAELAKEPNKSSCELSAKDDADE